MSQAEVISIARESMVTALTLAAPLLGVSLILGVVVSIFQAATQINEQTLTFIPKLIGVALVLFLLSAWMMSMMTQYVEELFGRILDYM